jgi:hypothetical protein
MKRFIKAATGQRRHAGMVATALLAAGALVGFVGPISAVGTAAGVDAPAVETLRTMPKPTPAETAILVGSYTVTGTDSDGKPYAGARIVDIGLAPSGALELAWDNGKSVGVGQVIGNVLAVASSTNGRTVILTMTINPDGSLSGRWSRRTDRGAKGAETWKRT